MTDEVEGRPSGPGVPARTPGDDGGAEGSAPPGLDLLAGTADGAFAVDAAGRVVGWNPAAERLFGFRREEVLGRPCHEALGCRDTEGRELGPSGCPVIQSLSAGRPPLAVEILVRHRTGLAVAVCRSALLLRGSAGPCALVLLEPSPGGVVDAAPGDLPSTLDRLLIATGAEAAEVFLAEPASGELLLAAHRGRAPRAFRQITRFEPGRGFPGLVAESGEPLVSRDLPRDDRYLRTLVKRQGFRTYLCVPISSGSVFLGSLHVASRRHDEALVGQLSFLAQVARTLGRSLELARLRAAAPIAGHLFDPGLDAGANLRGAADRALGTLIEAAEADCGALLLLDEASQALELTSGWGMPQRLRRTLARACTPTHCSALAQRRCLLRTDAAQADSPLCRVVLHDLATALCLPLVVGGKPLGVALVGCSRREQLPTRRLSLLHAMINSLTVSIHNAQVALREEGRVRRFARPDLRPSVEVGAPPDPEGTRLGAEAAAGRPAPVPFLDFRCLGEFTILADGRVLPLERFARRRSLTLLKILLTRHGRQVHREELMELLWPESDAPAAGVLLNVATHYLRRGLERNAPAGQPSSFVGRNGDYYFFNTHSPHRLDSQEFLQAADLGMRLEGVGEKVEAIQAYRRAVDLYAGDFLADEPYSDWCAVEREHVRERFLTVLRRVARLQIGQGDLEAGVACYRRALQADGTLEDVHRALMEALWRAGRRGEALHQYGECRAILDRELGIAPMPETEALRRRIATDRGTAPGEVAS